MKFLITLLIITQLLIASDFYRGTSFQSYSGIINTPNAEVMHEGSADLLYSNQVDSNSVNKEEFGAKNYLLNIGFFNFMEVSGRLAELCRDGNSDQCRNGYRDLSASAKVQIPYYNKYLPKVAFGVQDIGSAAAHYESKYVVASKQLYFVKATLGYATDSTRMNGIFGGIEVRAFDWLYLLAEHDTNEYAAAIRLITPPSLSKYANLSLSVKKAFSSVKSNNTSYFIAGVQFHLDKDIAKNFHLKKHLQEERLNASEIVSFSEEQKIKSSIDRENIIPSIDLPQELTRRRLQKKLASLGFENVAVGFHKNTNALYIAYENSMYNTNELDALGVVLGYATALSGKHKKFLIEMKKSNQYIRSISGDLALAKSYYKEATIINKRAFVESLKVSMPIKGEGIVFEEESANSSRLKTRIQLSPGVKSFVGTEYGNFDYLISLRTHIYWNLYDGLDFGVSADIPFLESDDLNAHNGRYRKYNLGRQVEDVLLHYTDSFYGVLNTLSIGQFKTNYVGFMNQTIYNYKNHTLKYKYMYAQDERDRAIEKEVVLLKYSYFWQNFDLFSELQVGQYWNFDRGFDVSIKRFFGDTAVALRFQSTVPKVVDAESRDHFAGLELEIPITPRKVSNYRYAQVIGTNNFSYYLRTTIAREDGTNSLHPTAAVAPTTHFEIENYLLNRNRLNVSYIKQHTSRLINAYKTYADEK